MIMIETMKNTKEYIHTQHSEENEKIHNRDTKGDNYLDKNKKERSNNFQ